MEPREWIALVVNVFVVVGAIAGGIAWMKSKLETVKDLKGSVDNVTGSYHELDKKVNGLEIKVKILMDEK